MVLWFWFFELGFFFNEFKFWFVWLVFGFLAFDL